MNCEFTPLRIKTMLSIVSGNIITVDHDTCEYSHECFTCGSPTKNAMWICTDTFAMRLPYATCVNCRPPKGEFIRGVFQTKLSVYAMKLQATTTHKDHRCTSCHKLYRQLTRYKDANSVEYNICKKCENEAQCTLVQKQDQLRREFVGKILLFCDHGYPLDIWVHLYSVWFAQLDVAKIIMDE